MIWLLYIGSAIILLYILLALLATFLASRTQEGVFQVTGPLPRISIVVAARNEEHTLPACLDALLAQDYPRDQFEILVADDHSTDETGLVLDQYRCLDGRLRKVSVEGEAGALHGKARALHAAIERSTGEIILTTDADCRPPPAWARNLATQFQDPDAGMVCGISIVNHRTMLDRVQALDWMYLLTLASASAEAGVPITAQGNNMAFRRQAYDAVGGYPALPFSVTEDYALLRAIHEKTPWSVTLSVAPELSNRTLPVESLQEVISQRRRWARGGMNAPSWVHGLYVTGFLTHLLLVPGLFLFPMHTLVLLFFKLVADLGLLYSVLERFQERLLLHAFLPFELYLFCYMIAMPFSLLLFPKIAWKERKF